MQNQDYTFQGVKETEKVLCHVLSNESVRYMLYITTGLYCYNKIIEKNLKIQNKILQVEKGSQMGRYLNITLSYHQQCMFAI
jgi:hypothetical protein